MIRLTQQHRGMAAVWLGGNEAAAAQREAKKNELEAAIATFDATLRADGAEASRLGRSWKRDREAWQALEKAVSGRQIDGSESSTRHGAAIAGLLGTLSDVGDRWELSFDAHPASYFLAIAALHDAPAMLELMGQTRARGAGLLAAKAALDGAEKARFEALQIRMRSAFAACRRRWTRPWTPMPRCAPRSIRRSSAWANSARPASKLAQEHVLTPAVPSFPSADYYTQTTAVIDGMYESLAESLAVLDRRLQAQARAETTQAAAALAAVLALFALAVWHGLRTASAIRRELGAEPAALHPGPARQPGRPRFAPAAGQRRQQQPGGRTAQGMQQQLAQTVQQVRLNAESVATASTQIARRATRSSRIAPSSRPARCSRPPRRWRARRRRAAQRRQLAAGRSLAREGLGRGAAGRRSGRAGGADHAGGINDSSRRIAEITGTIDGIAFQTNILALNAAVETRARRRAGARLRGGGRRGAHAGAAFGRGGAEIKGLIGASVERIEAGSRQAEAAGPDHAAGGAGSAAGVGHHRRDQHGQPAAERRRGRSARRWASSTRARSRTPRWWKRPPRGAEPAAAGRRTGARGGGVPRRGERERGLRGGATMRRP